MKKILTGILCALSCISANAADFFSSEKCDDLLTFGARIGVNTSNRTMGDKAFPANYHHENWGTGFDIGAVANINFRDYLTLQPGFFFEARHGSYVLMGNGDETGSLLPGGQSAQAGNRSSYNFTIPIMAVIGFNVTDNVRWTVEAGPYVSFVLNSKISTKRLISEYPTEVMPFHQKPASVDFGFKLGTGFEFYDHYYVGVHYIAGCINAWKDRDMGNLTKTYGGVTKAWVFSIGYNF